MDLHGLDTAPPRRLGAMLKIVTEQRIDGGVPPFAIPKVESDLFKPMSAECRQCCRMRGLGYQTDEIRPHRVYDIPNR